MWLNFILKISSIINKQKEKIIDARILKTIILAFIIIGLELFQLIISLPIYIFIKPEKFSKNKKEVEKYRLKRKFSLIGVLIFGLIVMAKIIIFGGLFFNTTSEIRAMSVNWNFNDPTEYVYDSSKIQIVNGIVLFGQDDSDSDQETSSNSPTSNKKSNAEKKSNSSTSDKKSSAEEKKKVKDIKEVDDDEAMSETNEEKKGSVEPKEETAEESEPKTEKKEVEDEEKVDDDEAMSEPNEENEDSVDPKKETAEESEPETESVSYLDSVLGTSVVYAQDNTLQKSLCQTTLRPLKSLFISELEEWTGFIEMADKNGGEIYYQLSDDNGNTWMYLDGKDWLVAKNNSDSNTANEIDKYISKFPTDAGQIIFKAFFYSDCQAPIKLIGLSIDYNVIGIDGGSAEYTVTDSDEAVSFLDTKGNVITRTARRVFVSFNDKLVGFFEIERDLDTSGYEIGYANGTSWIHLGDADRTGIKNIQLIVSRLVNQDSVRICPNATSADTVFDGCNEEIILSPETPSQGGYTLVALENKDYWYIQADDASTFSTGAQSVVDPVSFWSFDENSGTNTEDSIGSNDGVINGASWVNGYNGNALSFDGVDDWVDISDDASLNMDEKITVIAWVKPSEHKTSKIIEKETWNSGWTLDQDVWRGWKTSIFMQDGTRLSLNWGERKPKLDEWYHLAITYDKKEFKFFVNGALKDSVSTGNTIKLNNKPVSIGSDEGEQKFFAGVIDEVEIYNRNLSLAEIVANYEDEEEEEEDEEEEDNEEEEEE
ncbi:MAG: LamG-like jellyroll fold domain-containing protein, partial [Acidobacteriota bacterium]|nr:LamG-like jellyroll fold domain-containing protein [Acidobacteriota bacterium]